MSRWFAGAMMVALLVPSAAHAALKTRTKSNACNERSAETATPNTPDNPGQVAGGKTPACTPVAAEPVPKDHAIKTKGAGGIDRSIAPVQGPAPK